MNVTLQAAYSTLWQKSTSKNQQHLFNCKNEQSLCLWIKHRLINKEHRQRHFQPCQAYKLFTQVKFILNMVMTCAILNTNNTNQCITINTTELFEMQKLVTKPNSDTQKPSWSRKLALPWIWLLPSLSLASPMHRSSSFRSSLNKSFSVYIQWSSTPSSKWWQLMS